ncbi:MAG: GIY-YIG nuclease family protein [Patescibacteria group bacterium]
MLNYFSYILRSIKYPNRYYKGYTSNIETILTRHNSGQSAHTSKYKPWQLVCYCAFEDKKTALQFENYLKTASGIAFMRKRLLKK